MIEKDPNILKDDLLITACQFANEGVIKYLIEEERVTPNAQNEKTGQTPLIALTRIGNALYYNNLHELWLMENCIKYNKPLYSTPTNADKVINEAVDKDKQKRTELVKYLISKKANPYTTDFKNRSLLEHCLYANNKYMFEFLKTRFNKFNMSNELIWSFINSPLTKPEISAYLYKKVKNSSRNAQSQVKK